MKKIALILAAASTFTVNPAGADDKPSAHGGADAVNGASMFVVETQYMVDMAKAAPYLEDHKQWVEKYTGAGVFLFAGPKDSKKGGVIITDRSSKETVAKIMAEDVFVKKGIVSIKVTEFNPLFSFRK